MVMGALEIGGSHICVGAVDPRSLAVQDFRRIDVDSLAPWDQLRAVVGGAAADLRGRVDGWAAAMPGPFDYARGVGGLHPSGKFRAFADRDLNAGFADALGVDRVTWLNDAHAFGVGRHALLAGPRRVLALTFGSGIGSAFVADGLPLTAGEGVPPGGEVYQLPHDGGSLEDRFGPAALVRRHGAVADFRALCDLARVDAEVRGWVGAQFDGLADALAPWLRDFAPDAIAVGGSTCRSWDVFGPALEGGVRRVLGRNVPFDVVVDTERSAMVGAVAYAGRP
ncbi:ROK family protein [Mariniluteicoccus flavus]